MKERCPWPNDDPLMLDYHDKEWGSPVKTDRKHFEFLLLETMQAGLSWRTILHKRENYRLAFDGFDWEKISLYGADRIEILMQNAGIIRNRLKIEGAVKNAVGFKKIRSEFGTFNSYIWSFADGRQVVNAWKDVGEIPVSTELSDRLSLDMKKRGFSFVGTVTLYSHLQAIGVINDHLVSCFRYVEVMAKHEGN